MSFGLRVLLILGLLVAVPHAAAAAQAEPRVAVATGVEPAEVTVGDRFRVVIRVDAPAGVGVEFPEYAIASDTLEPVSPVVVLAGDADDPHIAYYDLVAWHPGELTNPVVPVWLQLEDGSERVMRVALPMPVVRSVLPAAPAEVEPRGAKPILDHQTGGPWWLLLVALLVALVAAAAFLWTRRRRRVVPLPRPDPRAVAHAELEAMRLRGLVEQQQWKAWYAALSGVVRMYLEALVPRWGRDLTTEELIQALLRDGADGEVVARVENVLRQADLVKFARAESEARRAELAWREANSLVDEIDVPQPGSGSPGARRDRPVTFAGSGHGGSR
jgi:hypothetical protein